MLQIKEGWALTRAGKNELRAKAVWGWLSPGECLKLWAVALAGM
jgi:hypothetical protein